MSEKSFTPVKNSPSLKGVMFNAYPDSIGGTLSDLIKVLQLPEFKHTFSLFYILPTFFNSDLDRGFSIIDYNLNEELVHKKDLEAMKKLGIELKFDIVLNHLSVASPQFVDLLEKGEASPYKDFFIDWNEFWKGHGELNEEGIRIPEKAHLDKLFMRKSGLPILKVPFPDGSMRPYWNTFYQKVTYDSCSTEDLAMIEGMSAIEKHEAVQWINKAIQEKKDFDTIEWGVLEQHKPALMRVIHDKRRYLGQMDVNGHSPLVWQYYEEVLQKVAGYGCKILRLDAFAYLHKEVGETNFFNTPGTWDYLSRINQIAEANGLRLLPEIHAEYGSHLHDEVAAEGYYIYDFFLPGLIIHAIEKNTNRALLKWAKEIVERGFKTVNMLGCHDGIPLLDLRGKKVEGIYQEGLLTDAEIEELMDLILARGGRVKNLYGADGKKISYYQINATYYSALAEDDRKMLLARAIQMFMPGIPQVWYLDVFCGKNDYEAADRAGEGGHKEINRTNLAVNDVLLTLQKEVVLRQLQLIRLRNTSKAFDGVISFPESSNEVFEILWKNGGHYAHLQANLEIHEFTIMTSDVEHEQILSMY